MRKNAIMEDDMMVDEMEEEEEDGVAYDMPEMAGGAPPRPAPAPMPFPPAPNAPVANGTNSDSNTDESSDDIISDTPNNNFQNVELGSRTYSHELRKGWSKFDNRIDFTETLLFSSA